MPGVPASPEERFWRFVNRSNGCWLWTGGRNRPGGYGTFDGKGAHRFSWCLHFGEIPDRLNVLHRCDNPDCVSPDHLFLGTQADNMTDMNRKGRHGKGRLTKHQVREIRSLRGIVPQRVLAERFRISRMSISKIQRRVQYQHVS